MTQTSLYLQIAESIRLQILQEQLQPGDHLPSVRDMAERWECTIGTIQRAYQELRRQDLIVSRPGQGTRVASALPARQTLPLHRAALVHRTEAFLLEVFTAGYTQTEVEQAIRLAFDRWRTLHQAVEDWPEHTLRFVGSHDPAMAFVTERFAEVVPAYATQLTFAGSLAGLIALVRGEADLAGTHLWDEESNTYNVPFIRRFLPGQPVALLTLAHRRLGLMILPSNPAHITGLADLTKSGLRFINRQPGTGTRIWLDAHLRRLGLAPEAISGYTKEVRTHSDIARTIAEGNADVGLGVEAAALAYGLDFLPLTTERYDLVIPTQSWDRPPVKALVNWLTTDEARFGIEALGGYDVAETGRVEWVNS
jgi:molybdate-binding protein/DNA-binding transcriptional regulator YhcF (GntR family)